MKAEKKDTIKITDFNAIKIGIASPEEILDWSHGEVLKPETINYRTQKPEKDGLFCEKIFGPTKDYECYCGKYKKIRYKGVICDKCGVEVTRSSVRRERMGHIGLAIPIVHIWYIRGVPSRIGLLLDMSPKELERIVYFSDFVILEVDEKIKKEALAKIEKELSDYKSQLRDKAALKNQADLIEEEKRIETAYNSAKAELIRLAPKLLISEDKYFDLSMKYGQIIKVGIGAEAIYELLRNIDLNELISDLKKQLQSKKTQDKKISKRLKVANGFLEAQIRPEWMVLKVLPVIPPDLRPMVQLDGGRFATADLNDLYRRIINRNNRLKKLLDQGAPEVICRNEKRMLQEAVDALVDSSARRDKSATQRRSRKELKSLSDMLRGKEGRFRQNLLGKRVDYSGRSVIVVGPELKLNQCGIPKEMALELFKPFIISKLISAGYAHNVKNATNIIDKKELIVWDILEEITSSHHVMLNRAPTLHRLGIQSFQPVLIEGKAIQIHPLICSAYNADFDGDQMAAYISLSRQAAEEAEKILYSIHNILKPATGEAVVAPSLDLVLGCYYLTQERLKDKGEGKIFSSSEEAIIAYQTKAIGLHAKIQVKFNDEILPTTAGRILFNQVFHKPFPFVNKTLNKKVLRDIIREFFEQYGDIETAELVNNIKDLGFKIASQSGITFSIEDIKSSPKKEEIIKTAKTQVEEIENQYFQGLISKRERYIKIVELWSRVKSEIEDLMKTIFDEHNSIYSMVNSGARGSMAQLVQIAGMKGQVANPAGKIIEFPIEASYKEGFNEFEYFIASHGARKGKTDTALRTADAGYLTRRLVDVAQDVIVTSKDCGTKQGIVISKEQSKNSEQDFEAQICGRILSEDIKDKKGKVLYKKNTEILSKEAKAIAQNPEIKEIKVFSVLTCENSWGVCQKCYGTDLGTGKLVNLGTAVGIIAAQAIGEPGTQLTLRTFHVGGVAEKDITQGLPRVEELFEARSPHTPAIISEINGKVKISKDQKEDLMIIKVISDEYREADLDVGKDYQIIVKDGEKIKNRGILAKTKNHKPIRALFDAQVKISGRKIHLKGLEKISRTYKIENSSDILVKDGDIVKIGDQLSEGHKSLDQIYEMEGQRAVERYIISEIQYIYSMQGVNIHDKHIELIVRQMFSRVRIKDPGDTNYLSGQIIEKIDVEEANKKIKSKNGKPATFENLILGITRVALSAGSFLSAASFQETTNVLIEAATTGQIDPLRGLKENVIIGKLIPAGTGFKEK